jgi:hypothetical protein
MMQRYCSELSLPPEPWRSQFLTFVRIHLSSMKWNCFHYNVEMYLAAALPLHGGARAPFSSRNSGGDWKITTSARTQVDPSDVIIEKIHSGSDINWTRGMEETESKWNDKVRSAESSRTNRNLQSFKGIYYRKDVRGKNSSRRFNISLQFMHKPNFKGIYISITQINGKYGLTFVLGNFIWRCYFLPNANNSKYTN